jgi:anthranilate synthase component 1
VIPVYTEINADLDTPVSAFLKLKKDEYAFLLESVEGQESIARFSFLGSNPRLVFQSRGRSIDIIEPRSRKARHFLTKTDPLDEVRKVMRGFKAVEVKGLPRFCGGLVGFIGYDTVRFFEDIPDKNPDELKMPDTSLMLTDDILVFDHVNHTIKVVVNVVLPGQKTKIPDSQLARIYAHTLKKIASRQKELQSQPVFKKAKPVKIPVSPDLISNYTKSKFKKMVEKAKDYIRKGDIIQVVLSQRFKFNVSKPAFEIYRSLRRINPSPYMFFLRFLDTSLVGASPEMLVRCEDGLLWTRPIAGTRSRGKTPVQDKALELELMNDEKEKAEHIMLLDLGRNDLGRICTKGTVSVSEFMSVERYSHVMHLVSEVTGRLNKKFDIYDSLRACFPAGTVSGAPKIRAMEIIDELENTRRGTYAGCVGYFSFQHNMDTCITLRTVMVKDNTAYVQAGAGIVADSIPEKEYYETLNKARALIEAINCP